MIRASVHRQRRELRHVSHDQGLGPAVREGLLLRRSEVLAALLRVGLPGQHAGLPWLPGTGLLPRPLHREDVAVPCRTLAAQVDKQHGPGGVRELRNLEHLELLRRRLRHWHDARLLDRHVGHHLQVDVGHYGRPLQPVHDHELPNRVPSRRADHPAVLVLRDGHVMLGAHAHMALDRLGAHLRPPVADQMPVRTTARGHPLAGPQLGLVRLEGRAGASRPGAARRQPARQAQVPPVHDRQKRRARAIGAAGVAARRHGEDRRAHFHDHSSTARSSRFAVPMAQGRQTQIRISPSTARQRRRRPHRSQRAGTARGGKRFTAAPSSR